MILIAALKERQKFMSDSLLDALDEISDEDENSEENEADAQDVNDALGGNEAYWKSRNQTKKVQKALQDSEDQNREDEDATNREE